MPCVAQSHDTRVSKSPQHDSEVEQQASIDVDLEQNELFVGATIVRQRTVDVGELFERVTDSGYVEARLKLALDPGFGWNGFEIRDGDLFRVNYLETDDGGRYIEESPADIDELEGSIRDVVEDEDVGMGFGDFAPRRPQGGL